MNKIFIFLFFLHGISTCFSQRIIQTIAGNGSPNFGLADGVPVESSVSPYDIAIDNKGNIYFSEASFSYTIRKIDHLTGRITTVAGNGTRGYSGDGGLATDAQFDEPRGIVLDVLGNLFVADYWNNRVRKIDAITGIVTNVAGNGNQDFVGDGGLAINASIFNPNDLAIDASGNIYIADLNNFCVRKVLASTGVISTIAGVGKQFGHAGDGSLATSALIAAPFSVAVDNDNNVYVADWHNNRIRKVEAISGIITTIAGTGELGNTGDGGPATSALLYGPQSIEADAFGNIYISEAVNTFVNAKIRRINRETGIISSIIGNGMQGYSGDNGPANEAKINGPSHLTFDPEGNIYLADFYNYRIRKISNNYQPPLPQIIFSDSCLASEISFQITSEFPVFDVQWVFDDPESSTLNISRELTPVHKFTTTGEYMVRVVISSDFGRDTLQATVNIESCICQVEVPNVFTPNNDGFNDEYYINMHCPLEFFKLSIINRWGQEVFNSTSVNAKWNGKQNGLACSSGVYFALISYKFKGSALRQEKSTVTLFR